MEDDEDRQGDRDPPVGAGLYAIGKTMASGAATDLHLGSLELAVILAAASLAISALVRTR